LQVLLSRGLRRASVYSVQKIRGLADRASKASCEVEYRGTKIQSMDILKYYRPYVIFTLQDDRQ
jgi:hypothetical protein